MFAKKSLDLIVVAGLAALASLVGLFGGAIPVLSPVLGLLLVLVLPGYALVVALFPTWPLWGAERLALTVGGSLGVAVVFGFLLNLSPIGLHPWTWSLLLGLVTLAAVVAARIRRGPEAVPAQDAAGVRLPVLPTVLLGLSVVVVIVALLVARAGAFAQPTDLFTQLWVLPADPEQPQVLQIGVRSQEAQPQAYNVQLLLGSTVVQEWKAITLAPGAEWLTPVRLPDDQVGQAADPALRVAVLLYRVEAPQEVYRRVLWWPNAPTPVPTNVPPPGLPAEWPTVDAPPGAPSPSPVPPTPVLSPTPAPPSLSPVPPTSVLAP